MPSTFGWLDADDEQRRKMIDMIGSTIEPGTLDELGIGSIRDSFSNGLFPGTSTIHTRLKYVLLIPWLLELASRKPTAREMAAEFTRLEYRLIPSLIAGGEDEGVIGRDARESLKRLPSVVYWGALGAWGIRDADLSRDMYFRRTADLRSLTKRRAAADDPESRELLPSAGLDQGLPSAPANLLSGATFELSSELEEYLSARIASATEGSLLSWLVLNAPANLAPLGDGEDVPYIWNIAGIEALPADLARQVDHARRFSEAIYGAPLVYNLLLARKSGQEELAAGYELALAEWESNIRVDGTMLGWDRDDFWNTVLNFNPRLRDATKLFVDGWLDLVATGKQLADSEPAAILIRAREIRIKGPRARFASQAALDKWSGSAGVYRLDYRWGIARSHLEDLYVAREAR